MVILTYKRNDFIHFYPTGPTKSCQWLQCYSHNRPVWQARLRGATVPKSRKDTSLLSWALNQGLPIRSLTLAATKHCLSEHCFPPNGFRMMLEHKQGNLGSSLKPPLMVALWLISHDPFPKPLR